MLKVNLVGKEINSAEPVGIRFTDLYQPYLEEVSK
jgi:hypothetical protein